MPQDVRLGGKSGTLLTIGGSDVLATFKTHKIGIKGSSVEHNGPQDDFECRTQIRMGATFSVDRYIAATSDSGLLALMVPGSPVLLSSDLSTGNSWVGTFVLDSVDWDNGDDPTIEAISGSSTGSFSLS